MNRDTSTEERLFRGHAGRILWTVSLGWLAVQCGRLLVPPLLPEIQRHLAIGPTRAGIALSVMWGLYAAMQFPSGRLSDALTRKTLVATGLALAVVGFAVVAAAPGYLPFLVGAAIVGVGSGCYPSAARALVTDLFVEKRGRAFGLHTGAGDVGGVVAAGLATLVIAVAAWRVAFLPVVAVLLAVLVAYVAWSVEAYELERRSLAVRETAGRLLGDGRLRWLLVAYALYAFAWQSTMGFLPTYLRVGKSFTPLVANAAFALLFGVGALAKPAAGAVSDRVPRERVAPAALLVGSLALAGVVVADSPLVALVAVGAFSIGLMSFPPVMQAHLMDTFADESAGGDFGAMRTVYIGFGALGPTFVGAVGDVAAYGTAFAVLVVLLAVAAALIVRRT